MEALVGVAVLAAAVAALAVSNVWRARAATRRHPPVGDFLTIDGVRLHYLAHGTGRPVVLLHGNVVSGEDFVLSRVMERLAAGGYRALAFDRPGFGHSKRPRRRAWTAEAQATLVAKACRALDLEEPIVVGHSWGVLVALGLALDHPSAIAGLVLLSGYYYPTLRADVALASFLALPIWGDVLRYTVLPPLSRLSLPQAFKIMFDPNPIPPTVAHGFPLDFAIRPGQLAAQNGDGAIMVDTASALKSRYGTLRLPVVILVGTDDRVVAARGQGARLQREIIGSRLIVVPNAGHMLHHAAPDAVVSAVDQVATRG